jgi:succinate dehydrogenase / fumarate reductase cytochrome b subunit
MTNKNRPISPHLQIYKPQITSILSISHRFTGIILYLSTFLITFYLLTLALATSTLAISDIFQEIYKFIMIFSYSKFGNLILFLITLSFIYHFLNGIRHLIWDLGFGFKIINVYFTGFLIIFLSLTLNFYFWFF